MKQVIDNFVGTRKCAKISKRNSVSKVWLDKVFDLSKCRCKVPSSSFELFCCELHAGKGIYR